MIFPFIYNCLSQNEFVIKDYKLVPIRYKDRLNIMKWRNEQMYHLRQEKPLTKKSQEDYFNGTVAMLFDKEEPDQILFSYLKNDKCIGYGGLVHINWIDKNAEISFVLNTNLESNEFSFHWSNYLELLEQVAFKELFLHKIFTYAFDLRPHLYPILDNKNYKNTAILNEHCFFEDNFIDVYIHEKKNTFSLKKVKQEDLRLLFKWVNDTKVRKNALNSNQIEWEKHVNWFTKKLSDSKSKIFIFENENTKIGQIRIDKVAKDRWVIDYSIDKDQRGKGYGFLMTNALLKRYNNFKFLAIVKSENIPSQKVFEKLKFSREFNYVDKIFKYYYN